MNIQQLKTQFPDLLFDTEQSLPKVRAENEGSALEIFLQGAHVSQFTTANGESQLFLSQESHFESGKAVRGGIPICFPWFGAKKDDASAPSHGFARIMDWELVEATDGELTFTLQSSPRTLALWPHEFVAHYRVAFDATKLKLAFEVRNTGTAPLTYQVALHTYYRVFDVHQISIEGLDGKTYLDQLEQMAPKTQQGDVTFEAETDRIYLDSYGPIVLRDGARSVRLTNRGGWRSTVVWNPWVDKSRALKDLGDDEWPGFVCIEAGAVADEAIALEAGESYQMEIEIEFGS